MRPLPSRDRLVLARARARRRRTEAGATMFIVATTLALLGAMGVYALTSTASETKSVGYVRQAAQAEHIAMTAVNLAAERIRPDTVQNIIAHASSNQYQDKNCRSATPYVAGSVSKGQACWRLNPAEIERQLGPSITVFGPESFSHIGTPGIQPDFYVEITNPASTAGTVAGFQSSDPSSGGVGSTNNRLRLTIAGISGHSALAGTVAPEVLVLARGNITTVSTNKAIIQR